MAASGFLLPSLAVHAHEPVMSDNTTGDADGDLLVLSGRLLNTWGEGLLSHQVRDASLGKAHGGLICPACSFIHGRCADAIQPLMYLAGRTGDRRYREAALLLYEWMENNVSMPDGSWVNEVTVSDWKGITVFTVIMLAETLIHSGNLLDKKTRGQWEARLNKGAEFIYKDFTIKTGNINYPVNGAYALALTGHYFKEQRFMDRGKELASSVMDYFTPNSKFLFGEGHPVKEPSAKKCYSVDLGYDVEESLPALVMYAQLTGDKVILETVLASMRTHMEFLLPDGGWDNSWGTRNFKWTYWGSRTTDGCANAYARMGAYDPRFYGVALANMKLLSSCTYDGLLHGGPHYHLAGAAPCIHHTFSHAKVLASLLAGKEGIKINVPEKGLPRAGAYGVKSFPDIATWLIAKGGWRATVTGYDVEYLMTSGHATGGALTLLWHEALGPVVTASMTSYQLVESFNMQRDKSEGNSCLTPRFEMVTGDRLFTNIHDLTAVISVEERDGLVLCKTRSVLRDKEQSAGDIAVNVQVDYTFGDGLVKLHANAGSADVSGLRFILPLIAAGPEVVKVLSPRELTIQKQQGILRVRSNVDFTLPSTAAGRIFNFVPGMQALPLEFSGRDVEVELSLG